MKAIRRGWRRFIATFAGGRHEDRLAEELRSHLDMLVDEKVRQGLSPDEARRQARLEFGEIESVKDGYRDQRGLPGLESLMRDARYALRGLRRNPGFSVAAIACLALGIGAATTIFSVSHAVLLRPLPVADPDRLLLFSWTSEDPEPALPQSSSGIGDLSLPHAAVKAFAQPGRTLSGAAAFVATGFDHASLTINKGNDAVTAGGEMVSGGYFSMLGVGVAAGRPLVEADLAPNAPNAVVLSYAFWKREFGAEPDAVGRPVVINGEPFTIVGVAAREFRGLDSDAAPDVWLPLRDYTSIRPWGVPRGADDVSMFASPAYFWCTIVGRMKPGMTKEATLAELNPVFRRTITEGLSTLPPDKKLPRLEAQPASRGLDRLRSRVTTPLAILGAGVALLLLIACTNVATLMLARSESRHVEIGIRLAIGASRARIVQQLLVEGIVLALFGGAVGVLLAQWGSPVLLLLLASADSVAAVDPGVDRTVLAFSLAASLFTGVAFGLGPAFAATQTRLAARLKSESRAVSSRRVLGRALIVGQVALSVMLLLGAGLFVRTLQNLGSQRLGFDSSNLLLFQLDAQRAGYEGDRAHAVYREAIDRMRRVPGVEGVTASTSALLSGWRSNSPTSTDGPPLPAGQSAQTLWNSVGPDFAETYRIPLIFGRGMGDREVWGRQRVALVSRSWAEKFFPNASPIGRRLSTGAKFDPAKSYEIIGVVEDSKYDRLRREPAPTAYFPFTVTGSFSPRLWIEVRTIGNPRTVVGPIREVLRGIDQNLALLNVRTQRDQIDLSLRQERMFASVSSAFGALALLLVGTGLFGVLAYAVSRRTTEIGVRMALGAGSARVLRMVLGEALLLVAIGVVIGLPVALLLARLVRAQFFGVTPTDGVTIAATLTLLLAIGLFAALVPARRAARVDPTQALRAE